jgi:hypothetical protein
VIDVSKRRGGGEGTISILDSESAKLKNFAFEAKKHASSTCKAKLAVKESF